MNGARAFAVATLVLLVLAARSAAGESIGDTSTGQLLDGVRLEESDALGILPRQRARDLVYGTAEMVALLQHAAAQLHQATGTRLWVGHLSRQGGGDIGFSVSHNSGRDADIAFCYQDRDGEPVDPTELIAIAEEGHAAKHNWRFDAARMWHIIKSLITFPGAEVEHLFMSNSLEGLVIQHAQQRGEDWQLVDRAAKIIRGAGRRAAPHNDHLHLRIRCSKRDIAAGCHASEHSAVRRAAIDQASSDLRLGEPAAAALRLAHLDASDEIVAWWEGPVDTPLRRRVIQALHAARSEAAAMIAAHAMAPREHATVRRAAFEVSMHIRHLAAVPALIAALGDPQREPLVEHALRFLTNRDHATQQRWYDDWGATRRAKRRQWLSSGFMLAGYDVPRLHFDHTWELVRALDGPAHLAANAADTLAALFSPRLATVDSAPETRDAWRVWIERRRELYNVPPPPKR